MPKARVPAGAICVLAISPDRGLTLAFRCTRVEFKKMFRDYTDDPAVLLAEAEAWPMCLRIWAGEIYAHGLGPVPGQKPWIPDPGRARQPRVTLLEAGRWVGDKPTYRILTKPGFVRAMASRWTDTAAKFDWVVENRGWLTDEYASTFGAPLVWVDGEERRDIVDLLIALRDQRMDRVIAPVVYSAFEKNLLLKVVRGLPTGKGSVDLDLAEPRQWPIRSLLGIGDDAAKVPVTMDASRATHLRGLVARIGVEEPLEITSRDLRALRQWTVCVDCGASLALGEACWYYTYPRCSTCEEAESPRRVERQEHQAADFERRVQERLDADATRRRDLTSSRPAPRSGPSFGMVLGFLIGREIGRHD